MVKLAVEIRIITATACADPELSSHPCALASLEAPASEGAGFT